MSVPPEESCGAEERGGGEFEREVVQIRHDLRNPLGHIMGFAELLRDAALQRGYEESLADLSSLEKESERLIALINAILDPGMLVAGRSDLGQLVGAARKFCADVMEAVSGLDAHARGRGDEHFLADLALIQGSAVRLLSLTDDVLEPLGDRLGARPDSASLGDAVRVGSGAVLVADCTELIRRDRLLTPGESLAGLRQLHRSFDRAVVEARLWGQVLFGGFYAVVVPDAGTAGGLGLLAELALRLREMEVRSGGGCSVVGVGLAVGELLLAPGGSGGAWGETVTCALGLAVQAPPGVIRLDETSAGWLRSRFVVEGRDGAMCLIGKRVE